MSLLYACCLVPSSQWQITSVSMWTKTVPTTQFPRRLIKQETEVRQSQGSIPPFPHRYVQTKQFCIALSVVVLLVYV
jgi:hypothetical protein